MIAGPGRNPGRRENSLPGMGHLPYADRWGRTVGRSRQCALALRSLGFYAAAKIFFAKLRTVSGRHALRIHSETARQVGSFGRELLPADRLMIQPNRAPRDAPPITSESTKDFVPDASNLAQCPVPFAA